jgi:hypothetical protein
MFLPVKYLTAPTLLVSINKPSRPCIADDGPSPLFRTHSYRLSYERTARESALKEDISTISWRSSLSVDTLVYYQSEGKLKKRL